MTFEIHTISDKLLHFFPSDDVLLITVGKVLVIVFCFRVQDLLLAIIFFLAYSDREPVDYTVSLIEQVTKLVGYVRVKFMVNIISNMLDVTALSGVDQVVPVEFLCQTRIAKILDDKSVDSVENK